MQKLLILLTALTVTVSVHAQQVLDRIAAIVDDEVILQSEVVQMAFMAGQQMGIDVRRNPQQFQALQQNALQNMVMREVLLIQADKDTIEADEAQVEQQLQQQMSYMIQQVGGEDKIEEAFGMPLSHVRRKYREDIEKEMRVQAVREQYLMDVTISRREVEKFFKSHRDSLGTLGKSVDLSHILIESTAGEEARMEALEKAVGLRRELVNGADFAELAREHSDDPGSAARGGDLGFMSRDEFVRAYAEAAMELEPGELSEVVESEFGFHIIQLLERRGDKIHTRHILISVEPTEKDQIKAANQIKEIHKKLKDGADWNEMVQEYSDDESTVADNGHLGLYQIEQLKQQVKEWTFAIRGVEAGEITDPVQTQYGFHVLKVNDRQEARQYDLDNDYDRLAEMALNYKKQNEFTEWVNDIKKDVYIEYKTTSR